MEHAKKYVLTDPVIYARARGSGGGGSTPAQPQHDYLDRPPRTSVGDGQPQHVRHPRGEHLVGSNEMNMKAALQPGAVEN